MNADNIGTEPPTNHPENPTTPRELSIAGVVTLKGVAYSDAAPAVKLISKATVDLVDLMDATIRFPAIVCREHLKPFLKRYRERLDEVGDEREPPSLKETGLVLRELPLHLADEEFQRMFADLLGSFSDPRTKSAANPGYASTLSEMRAADARTLQEEFPPDMRTKTAYREWSQDARYRLSDSGFVRVDPTRWENLIRLGVFEQAPAKIEELELGQAIRKTAESQSMPNLRGGSQLDVRQIERDAARNQEKLREGLKDLKRSLQKVGDRHTICLTDFGVGFLTCLFPPSPITEPNTIPDG